MQIVPALKKMKVSFEGKGPGKQQDQLSDSAQHF